MPVYLRTEALVDFDDRVLKLGLLLQRPVSRFLDQPRAEAYACFRKMFNAFAESPLLGLSALAGMVGLFAYAKAVLEFGRSELYIGSLISASDVTAFAIRLGVPFVLLALAIAAVVFGLVMILAVSQRDEPGAYWGLTIVAVISYGLLLLAYGGWIQAGAFEGRVLLVAWVLASVVLFGLALKLYKYGQAPGVADEDMLQRRLLSVLHFITLPGFLLCSIVAIGLYLTVPQHASILFDPPNRPWWRTTQPESSRAKGLMVVVAKSIKQPIVASRITGLGPFVAVQEVGSRALSAAAQSGEVKDAPEHWLLLQSADVRCVGPFDGKGECGLTDSSHDALSSNPQQGSTAQRDPPPRRGAQPGSDLAPAPASIARYAQTLLNCDAGSFGRGSGLALVFKFGKGYPGRELDIKNWERAEKRNGSFRVMQVSGLTESDLEGISGSELANGNPREFLRGGRFEFRGNALGPWVCKRIRIRVLEC